MSHIKNLNLKLSSFELSVDDLQLPDHGVTAFMGPSGSGKSSFIQTLIGLHHPVGWSWNFKGELLSELPVKARRLGVVFQSYDLFPHMTAAENVEIVVRSRTQKSAAHSAELQSQMKRQMKLLQLEKCWQTRADRLSGGEKQRVALLRAFVSQPRLLLLDEPFAALDEELRIEARALLKELIQESQIPVYIVTHDAKDAVSLEAQAVYNVRNGRISRSN